MNEKNKLILTALISLVAGAGISIALVHYHMGSSKNRMAGAEMMHGGAHMQNEMDGMMQNLSGKTGDAFDQAFIAEMITHHEGAVQMAQAALQNAHHTEIKEMAQEIIAAQNAEIVQMKEWQQSWYGQ